VVHGLFIRHLQGLGIVHLAETRDTLKKNLGNTQGKEKKRPGKNNILIWNNVDMVVLLVDSYSIFW
jgi:hypothetical protein